ncbi:MAG: AMP-binding protein [Actinomycetota bacterium]|nr:AMP-binding protein [Actinomycetota bacterium]
MRKNITFANIVDRAAKAHGDRICTYRDEPVRYRLLGPENDGTSVTFKETLEATCRIADGLKRKLGVKCGDRIAVLLTNVPEFPLIAQAAARLGAITVPYNYMLKAREITKLINDCGARVLLTEPQLFNMNIKEKSNVPEVEHWLMVGPEEQVPEDFMSLDELADGMNSYIEPYPLDPDDIVAIFYTSGTTGFPKGAMLTSGNMLATTRLSVRLLRIGKKDFGVTALPMAHIFGFNTTIVGGLYSGSSGILLRFFDPEKVLHSIEKYRATTFMGVPAMYNMLLLAHPEKYNLSSIRYWISGADAMPVEHIKIFEALGGKFIEGYGLVETSPIVSVNPPFMRKPGSIGIPVPGVKVRIMSEDGKLLRRGKVGEIVVRGPNVMKGYWNEEEGTREAFKYGWFHTGDMGYRDKLGFIYFVDREKDVVKTGGYSVFSCEIEEEILENPKVFKVAVVGVSHPTKGQVPYAVIQLKEGEKATEEELLDWIKKHIAAYKAPRKVKIIDEMPLTMTLKVLKRELRKKLEAEEGIKEAQTPT